MCATQIFWRFFFGQQFKKFDSGCANGRRSITIRAFWPCLSVVMIRISFACLPMWSLSRFAFFWKSKQPQHWYERLQATSSYDWLYTFEFFMKSQSLSEFIPIFVVVGFCVAQYCSSSVGKYFDLVWIFWRLLLHVYCQCEPKYKVKHLADNGAIKHVLNKIVTPMTQ